MPYVHTCSRCKGKVTTAGGDIPVCPNRRCRDNRRGGKMTRGTYVPPCASCGGELVETPSGFWTCIKCDANGLMTLDMAITKHNETLRPQWEAAARASKEALAAKREAAAELPMATIVPESNLYRLDGVGFFRKCKPDDNGATKCLVVSPQAARRNRVRVGYVRRAKRIGGVTLPETDSY